MKDGSIPRILFFCVAGLSARYSSHETVAHIPSWERGRPYTEEAERLLDLHNVCLTSIQACVLLGIAAATEGEPAAESVFYSAAYRMALILDLPCLAASSALEKELNIRGEWDKFLSKVMPQALTRVVWWSLLTIDTWNSSALCIPRTIKWRDDVALPMDEWTWMFLHHHQHIDFAEATNLNAETPSFSILGHKVKLNLLLYDIIKLNMSVVAEPASRDDVYKAVLELERSLDDWLKGLPTEWQYREDNLLHWTKEDMGRLFMSVHLDFNHACQFLYFQFLYLSQEPGYCNDAKISHSLACELAQKCNHHAAAITQLLQDVSRYPNAEVSHSLLGHIVSIASAVQIHTLLFSPNETAITTARIRLEENFATLTRLYKYWPNVAASFSRLETFHNSCLRSKDSSFRLDPWMLHFIVEFARPVHDKEDGEHEEGLWTLARLKHMLET